MNRRPPAEVKKVLRTEVGFGCPVPGCGSPFLEWHHFDPPWSVKEHHHPEGMVALCRAHHIQADHGAFTNEQLNEFKINGKNNTEQVKAKFNWLRNKILTVAGGNYYYNTPCLLNIDNTPIIWFNRDGADNLLINFIMVTLSSSDRAYMNDNEIILAGGEVDVEAPPSAKQIKITYSNKDSLFLGFEEYKTEAELIKAYPKTACFSKEMDFPITVLELNMSIGDSNFNISKNSTTIGGLRVSGNLFEGVGISIDSSAIKERTKAKAKVKTKAKTKAKTKTKNKKK